MILAIFNLGLSFFVAATEVKTGHGADHTVATFILQITVMLLVGRLLGEVMQRVGQPAVMGQLMAGILIGPSVLGTFWPSVYHAIFIESSEQKKMIDAISQLGVLMLLLLTGMETDLGLVKKMRRSAFFSSISGVVFPFTCGLLLGQFLPEDMLPDPSQRLITSLFLATALSISSVKIVAMVLMEVDFMRRNIGQIILASAILDDTIGWIIIALIGGIASGGAVHLGDLGLKILGTVVFLGLSFTIGRRMVAHIIRWTNDKLSIEMPVITAILILMFLMALATDYIGVHTVLGAFVAGILIGQSPILTRHIQEQLRGLIVALFAPIFFAVAGLSINLTILKNAYLIKLALGLILVASVGKLVGCYIGGRLGRLGPREATALAIGMNARGSTEVIVASIGLSMGVLSQDLFTLIVVMAVSTTLITPPLLRWALARIPPTGEEKDRLEREAAEAKDFVPKVERILVAVDDSPDGKLASSLAGLFSGGRQILATVLHLGPDGASQPPDAEGSSEELVKRSIELAQRSAKRKSDDPGIAPTVRANPVPMEQASEAILNEAKKGYDMLFLGTAGALTKSPSPESMGISIEKVIGDFQGTVAIAVAKSRRRAQPLQRPMKILVPTTGTDYSRRAAEVAVAIAKASRSRLTVLHVAPPPDETILLRQPQILLSTGLALVRDVQTLGRRENVRVKPLVKVRKDLEAALLRQIRRGRYDLVVLGVKIGSSVILVRTLTKKTAFNIIRS